MKLLITFPAYEIYDLEQDVIEMTPVDCDVSNPDRRRFCIVAKSARGEVYHQEVSPFNVWDYYAKIGQVDQLPKMVEGAESNNTVEELFDLTSCGVSITAHDRPREKWFVLQAGQKVRMAGYLLSVAMADRNHGRFDILAAPAPVEPVAAAPRATLEQAALVAALELGPVRLGSLTLEKGATRYLMRDERSGKAHSLEISETCPRRLTAHWQGFVKNADVSHGEDVVLLLPVNTPSGRRLFDCDKVAIIDALDQLASQEGHPLHGLEFRVHYSPSSVDGPATFWGDSEKIERANLAQVVADLIAARPPYRYTVTLPRPVTAEMVDAVRAHIETAGHGANFTIEHGDALAVMGLSPEDPAAASMAAELANLLEA
jgi:hypothetical protein